MRQRQALHKGFSLIEVIVVIVVLSIMSIGVVGFISSSSQGYTTTANRNQLSASGRMVIDRIAFELHNALPNSIRINAAAGNGNQCIEFVPVIAASTYIDAPFGAAADEFDVVEFMPDQTAATAEGPVFALIYPNRSSEVYEEPVPARGPRKQVDSIAHNSGADSDRITLVSNHRFSRRSPVQRIFLTREPVSFCVVGSRIYRYSEYGFFSSQALPGGNLPATTNDAPGKRFLIADSIDNAGLEAFNYLEPSRRRNAVLQLELNFSERGDSITLNHEVLLQATP